MIHPIRGTAMHKTIAIAVLALALAACGMISTLVDGFKYARAVESDLAEVTGMKPAVGFNWNNGRLLAVTVTFPHLYDAKPVRELAEAVRAAVGKEFKQTPENIVLAFSLGSTSAGQTAQLEAE
jgi:ABC-type glycerol-3-phosphate transport system substrate-binding protein